MFAKRLIALATVLTATTVPARAAAPASALSFFVTTLPGSDNGSEPSLAISTDGTRYVPWQAPGKFASSPDGVHFRYLGVVDDSAIGDVTSAVDASGALYLGEVCGEPHNILHTCVYRSLDGGRTWPLKTQIADNHPGASDRPWIDVSPHRSRKRWKPDKTKVFLEYHTFSPEVLVYVTVSRDGGHSFSTPRLVSSDTNALVSSGCNTVPGGIAADDRTGIVAALWLSGNDVASSTATGCQYSGIGPFNRAWVSVSMDGGETWTSHQAWEGHFDPVTKRGDNAGKFFATIAFDKAGQIHVVLPVRKDDDPLGFVAECSASDACREPPRPTDLLLVTSPDRGEHWTRPFRMSVRRGSYFFPWIAAGKRGVIDAITYHSSTLRPNDRGNVWYATFSQLVGAWARVSAKGVRYVRQPQVTEVRIDPKPAHRGGICTFGTFCGVIANGNRNLFDAIAIALDPGGGANVAWTVDVGTPKVSAVRFACQSRGRGAYGGSLERCWNTSSPAHHQ